MENEEQQQKKMEHFSHKHPLTLIEKEGEEETSKPEYRSFLRCYGCTEEIKSGVAYYRCEEDCPFFCLHHACAHLPTTIKRRHSLESCDGELQLKERLHQNHQSCFNCKQNWYRFAYVCSVCTQGLDIICSGKTRGPNEAKHSFHQHPVQPDYYQGTAVDNLLLCSVCSLTIKRPDGVTFYYRCNYCNFNVHPDCTDVPLAFISPSLHPHPLYLDFHYLDNRICKICQEEIDRTTQWAYFCAKPECNGLLVHGEGYFTHGISYDCLRSTVRKGDFQHFDHHHPLALVGVEEEGAPPLIEGTRSNTHSMALNCHVCTHKISSSVSYFSCVHCKSYHLHGVCANLPRAMKHGLHPNCTLILLPSRRKKQGVSVICFLCDQKCNGFTYHCLKCNFDLDIECAMRILDIVKNYHKHPLFISLTKGSFACHACGTDTEGTSLRCNSCQFWVHNKCACLPMLKDKSSHEHEHDLELIYTIPEKYSRMVVYCRICMNSLEHHKWAYHCDRCRYFTHVYDCSNPRREGDGVTINASDVVHLPLATEQILEEKLTKGKVIKHHRHPMILFADQLESSAIDITTSFMNLIRGSTTWPTFRVNGKDYTGLTFSFYNNILTLQVTGVDLPRYIKHEDHPHVLESTCLNSSTWCHACEHFFFGRGFKCTTCAFTIDTYCALLPRIIKHRYDKHGFFSLTYSAIEGVEEYVCEICEKDVTPRYFYHCVACDQSIHARCIWQAYVRFQPRYRLDLHTWPVFLVPSSQDLSQCNICEEKETFGHGFAFQSIISNKFVVHLTCISEDDVHTC